MYSADRIHRVLQFPEFHLRLERLPAIRGSFIGFTKVLLFKGDGNELVATRVVMDNMADRLVDRLLIRYYEVYRKHPLTTTVDADSD